MFSAHSEFVSKARGHIFFSFLSILTNRSLNPPKGFNMKHITVFIKNFLKCGLTGWCMEIIFTSIGSLRNRDLTLRGVTSIWMFPIYGCAAIVPLMNRIIRKRPFWFRGLTYMSMIFSTEYLTGRLLSKYKLCPWDYGKSRWNIDRVVRLDYAPYWFGAGLLFERLLVPSAQRKEKNTPRR